MSDLTDSGLHRFKNIARFPGVIQCTALQRCSVMQRVMHSMMHRGIATRFSRFPETVAFKKTWMLAPLNCLATALTRYIFYFYRHLIYDSSFAILTKTIVVTCGLMTVPRSLFFLSGHQPASHKGSTSPSVYGTLLHRLRLSVAYGKKFLQRIHNASSKRVSG